MGNASVRCSACGHTMVVPDETRGQLIDCKSCGQPVEVPFLKQTASGPRTLVCPQCNVQMIATEKRRNVSVGGILGAAAFVVGLLICLSNPILGVLVMILGLILGAVTRSKYTAIMCPLCKKER